MSCNKQTSLEQSIQILKFYHALLISGSSVLANLDPCPPLILWSEKSDIGNIWPEMHSQLLTIDQSSMKVELVNRSEVISDHMT